MEFQQSWKYYHPLSDEQIGYATERMQIAWIATYHGGRLVFTLLGSPGYWHEECFELESCSAVPLDYKYSGELVAKHLGSKT